MKTKKLVPIILALILVFSLVSNASAAYVAVFDDCGSRHLESDNATPSTTTVEWGTWLHVDPATAPEGLDLSNPHDGWEEIDLLHRVVEYVKTHHPESFEVLSELGHPCIRYESVTGTVEINIFADYDLHYDGTFDYEELLACDPYVYTMGQATLPNWQGESPSQRYKEQIFESLENRSAAWTEVVEEKVYIAWTDDLEHRFILSDRLAYCDDHVPTVHVDDWGSGAFDEWGYAGVSRIDTADPAKLHELYREGKWDGAPVRCGRTTADPIARVDHHGQILMWYSDSEYNFEVEDSSWSPTGYFVALEGHYEPHRVVESYRDANFLVTLSDGELNVFHYEEKVLAIKIEYNSARIFQGLCGCLAVVTDEGTWWVVPHNYEHGAHHVGARGEETFPAEPPIDPPEDYVVSLSFDGSIKLVAMSDSADTAIVQFGDLLHLVASDNWHSHWPTASWTPTVSPEVLAQFETISFEGETLILDGYKNN